MWAAPTAAKGARPAATARAAAWSVPSPASSYGQLGALNAESICERILRAGGLVLDDGNTMLADATLEKL